MSEAELTLLIKLLKGDIAANERTRQDLQQVLILSHNNLLLGALAVLVGVAVTATTFSVWPVGAVMCGLGGWTAFSAATKRASAKRELVRTEAKLLTAHLKLESLRETETRPQ